MAKILWHVGAAVVGLIAGYAIDEMVKQDDSPKSDLKNEIIIKDNNNVDLVENLKNDPQLDVYKISCVALALLFFILQLLCCFKCYFKVKKLKKELKRARPNVLESVV